MKQTLLVVMLAAVGCACSSTPAGLEQVDRRLSSHAAAVQSLDARVAALGQEWTDVRLEYERAARAYKAALRALQVTEQQYAGASQANLDAAKVAARAEQEWRLAQALVLVAAAMDAARIDAARLSHELGAVDPSCAGGMSTHAYRMLLTAQGVSLEGKDIGHIFPSSLGGPDHPDNYAPMSASLNRSLGNAWSRDICMSYGAARCARAIAISRKCGTLRGFGF